MEYYDQFPGEDIEPAGGYASNPEKDEEELDKMIQQQRQQAAQQQQQQVQPQQPAPADTIDNPISQLVEDLNVGLVDLVDNVFQGNSRSREEIASNRREIRTESAEQMRQVAEDMENDDRFGSVVAREGTRAVLGGVAGVVEQPVRFAQQIMGQEASFNLGIAENKTAVGEFARSTITLLGLMKGAGAAGVNVGGGASVSSRLATETARGAVADFIMEEGEGNLSNLLGDINPDLQDTFFTALAHEDDDNIYIRKLKNAAEGGVFGVAVDGVGEFIGAIRAARKAKPKGRDAVVGALNEYFEQTELDLGISSDPIQKLGAHEVFTEVVDGDYSHINSLDSYELQSLVNDYHVLDYVDDEADARALIDIDKQMEALGNSLTTKELPNGSKIVWSSNRVSTDNLAPSLGQDIPEDVDLVRIDWSINEGGDLGSHGTKLYSQFGEVAKAHKPGTIIAAEPASDGYGKAASDAQKRANQASMDRIDAEWVEKYGLEEWQLQNPGVDPDEIKADWDAKDAASKQGIVDTGIRNGTIPPLPEDYGSDTNIRSKLYQRAGMSKPDSNNIQYGIVKYRPDGRKIMQPLDFTRPIKEQIDEALDSAFQFELDVDSVTGETRQAGILIKKGNTNFDPNIRSRLRESVDNNAQSVETNLYEPNERAAITSGDTPTDVAQSLIDAGDSTDARRMATDETFRGILTASNAEEALQAVIKAVADNLDIDSIYDKLREANNGRQSWVLESIPVLDEFLEKNRDANDFSSLQQLLTKADGTVVKQYMTDEGALAVRVLAKDTANQISDIARQMKEVEAVNGDSYRQAEMLLDRLQVLSKMNIEASYEAGSKLQRRNTSKFNIRKILGEADGDAALKQAKSDETITKLREALADGDPQAKAEFQTLADAVALVDGNPEKIMSFWQKWRTVGAAGLRSAMYNGYLASSASQIRNFVGNEFNIMLRPAAQALGFARQGNFDEARIQLAAYHGLWEMHGEAFDIFKKSFAASAEDTSQVVRFQTGQPGTGRQLVENMKSSAKTRGERGAAEILDMYYSVMTSGLIRMPTRGLQAADDAARTLIARMELKKDAMRNSFEKGQGFKVDEKRYAKLVEMKIDGKGNLLDQRLLDTAKEVTFQEDLSGFGKTLQDLSNQYSAAKLMFPFVKTPMNIMRQTASYIPGVHQRFIKDFQDALDAGDAEKIAMYKGREALGFLTMVSAVGLAANGLITGRGPVDKQKRELWLKNNQPNSIKTPFGWVSYETIEPLNTILSAATDLIQFATAGKQSAYDRSFAQFSYALAAATVEKSYFQGLIDTAALMNIRDTRWGYLASAKIAQTGNTLLLPWSGARAQLSRLLQPGKQEFDNVWQQEMQRALPSTQRLFGVDRVDILENKPMQFGSYFNNFWNVLTPFDVTQSDPDSVAKRLGELGVDITLSFSDTFKGIDLTAREKQQFNQYLADTGIGKELKDLMASDTFRNDEEAWKESNKGHDPPPQWLNAIHQKLRRAKRRARAAMLADNPTFANKVNLNQAERNAVKRGQYGFEPPDTTKKKLEFILEY